MPICSVCGEDNPERSRFCLRCGAPVGAEAPRREGRRTITILFSDLKGSTALGEHLDPESVRGVMARYFAAMRAVIERHGGTVEKFIGDAIMAAFGVPELHEDDALRAVRAACEMRSAQQGLNDELEERFGVRLEVRTGVNTGEVVAGDPSRGEFFATGDAVNVAARLEQAAGPGETLIGPGTERLVRHAAVLEATAPLSLKGKATPLPAYRLLEVSATAPGVARRLDSPLVGREPERRRLEEAFARVSSERSCRLVTVLGDAGVGKSRLAHEFVEGLADLARVLRGRCLPYGEGITFWPLAEALREAAGIAEWDAPEEARAKLAALVPEGEDKAAVLRGVGAAVGLSEAGAGREETFWAFRRLLGALACERGLVLVLDDIQWGEESFLDLVEQLAAVVREPLLLLCLARPELAEARPRLATTEGRVAAIRLEPLEPRQSRVLISGLLGDAGFADEDSRLIADAAGGNPLFIEELLRMCVEEGVLARKGGRWRATIEIEAAALPPTIEALLAARLDRLESAERQVLEPASVIGEEFWRGAVAELCAEVARGRLGDHLAALVRGELVRPSDTSLVGEDAYRFHHLLLRDATYRAILKEVRAELHERFADWLEQRAGERVAEYEEILGYHLEQAYRYRKALAPIDESGHALAARAARRLGAAGRRAFARSDLGAAVKLLERASALLPKGDPWRLELLVDTAIALTERGEFERADELLGEVIDLAKADNEGGLRVRALIERANIELLTGSAATSLMDIAEEAIDALEELGDELGSARAWMLRGALHWWACQASAAASAWEHALRHARRARAQREEEESLGYVAGAHTLGPTPVAEAMARCEQLLAEGSGRRRLEANVLAPLSGLHAMQGRFEEARALYARGQAIYAELGLQVAAAGATQGGGLIEMLAGDPAAAARELRRGYETLERVGEKGLLSTNAAQLAEALHAQGRDAEAERFVAIAQGAAAPDDISSQATIRVVAARLQTRRGKYVEGERLGREALELAARTDFYALQTDARMALAEVLLAAGRKREGIAEIETALGIHLAKGDLASADRARSLLNEVA